VCERERKREKERERALKLAPGYVTMTFGLILPSLSNPGWQRCNNTSSTNNDTNNKKKFKNSKLKKICHFQ
jgi:hypothetical protein